MLDKLKKIAVVGGTVLALSSVGLTLAPTSAEAYGWHGGGWHGGWGRGWGHPGWGYRRWGWGGGWGPRYGWGYGGWCGPYRRAIGACGPYYY